MTTSQTFSPKTPKGWPVKTSAEVDAVEPMIWPKISVVTPNYNYAHFLDKTMRSVLDQQYANLEYVVIDGGSTDKSVDVIRAHEKHLAYWEHASDEGQWHAINKGFSHTNGDIMAWLNSDDMYCPWAFQTVAEIMMSNPEIEWLTTSNPMFWDCHDACINVRQVPGYAKDAFLDGAYVPWTPRFIGGIQQESTFWRRSLWERAGGYVSTEFSLAGDFDLWSRFYRHADLYSTMSPLGGFRIQEDQKTNLRQLSRSECLTILEGLRAEESWTPHQGRRLLRRVQATLPPSVRKTMIRRLGYDGKCVVRRSPGNAQAAWAADHAKFFYP
jgi:glycosyltransferase involved in cell wall biosynthesis